MSPAGLVAMAYVLGSMAYVGLWRGDLRYRRLAQYLFAPLNCLLYLATPAAGRRPVLDTACLPRMARVRQHWEIIRDEALALQAIGAFEPGTAVGRHGYRRGWHSFPLSWFGTSQDAAHKLCPHTLALLAQVPGIRGARFCILPAGVAVPLRCDALAGCLRYHLGLATPDSALCSLHVDGIACTWNDGRDLAFDGTYPHHAHNATRAPHLVLVCDVDRPVAALARPLRQACGLLARLALVRR